MRNGLTSIVGMPAMGADMLRERMRWSSAELRWHHTAFCAPTPLQPPPSLPKNALRYAAQLTRFTVAVSF